MSVEAWRQVEQVAVGLELCAEQGIVVRTGIVRNVAVEDIRQNQSRGAVACKVQKSESIASADKRGLEAKATDTYPQSRYQRL